MASANEDTSRHAKRTVKQCEKMIKTIEAKVERALNEDAKDDLIYFDQLGIDFIMADEVPVRFFCFCPSFLYKGGCKGGSSQSSISCG